jgi:glyoxalase family protein
VTGDASRNVEFHTRVLGLRLVRKTVNQGDVSAYHLFYADRLGSPGTDMTFFDWPRIGPNRRGTRGTDSIATTALRVKDREALEYWAVRLTELSVLHHGPESFAGQAMLRFEDPEGQRLVLVEDGDQPFEGEPWEGGGVPDASALRGFHAIMLSVPSPEDVAPILERTFGFRRSRSTVYPGGYKR